jgi:hypothetical protein
MSKFQVGQLVTIAHGRTAGVPRHGAILRIDSVRQPNGQMANRVYVNVDNNGSTSFAEKELKAA